MNFNNDPEWLRRMADLEDGCDCSVGSLAPMCDHSDIDECRCSCHTPIEYDEPTAMHIVACCDPCFSCGRQIAR